MQRGFPQHELLMLPPGTLLLLTQARLGGAPRGFFLLELAQMCLVAAALCLLHRRFFGFRLLPELRFFSLELLLLTPRRLFLGTALLL